MIVRKFKMRHRFGRESLKVIGEATFEEFENFKEAEGFLGQVRMLKMVNKRHKIESINRDRGVALSDR